MQDALTIALAIFTVATSAGTVSGFFYGFRQKTTIEVLERSNRAYEERNKQLEADINAIRIDYDQRITLLEGQVETLKGIKTPPLDIIKDELKHIRKEGESHHEDVMAALGVKHG